MAYFHNVFDPETWSTFLKKSREVCGFRNTMRRQAERVKPGDIFLCYVTRLSRWCGAFEVQSECYDDDSPIYGNPDPYTVRFKVKPLVILDHEDGVPLEDTELRGKGRRFQRSLAELDAQVGKSLLEQLQFERVDLLKRALQGTFVVYTVAGRPPTLHRAECRFVGQQGLVSCASPPTGWYLIGFARASQAMWAAAQSDPSPIVPCGDCDPL